MQSIRALPLFLSWAQRVPLVLLWESVKAQSINPCFVLARDNSSFVKDRGVRNMSTIGLFRPSSAVWMIAPYRETTATKYLWCVEKIHIGVLCLPTRLRLRLRLG
jgi:hypothetical protein